MASEPDATTVQVKYNTYDALDKLKERGESFDDVIKRLIDNTAVGMDNLKRYDDALIPNHGDIEPINKSMNDDTKKRVELSCSHFNPVTGVLCDNEVKYMQRYEFEENDGGHFYYCEEHVPEGG